jgi:hypothetical protein
MAMDENDNARAREFARQANRAPSGALGELVAFLRENKKWWLAPIVIVLVALAALVILSGTAAAPFIYPLF